MMRSKSRDKTPDALWVFLPSDATLSGDVTSSFCPEESFDLGAPVLE